MYGDNGSTHYEFDAAKWLEPMTIMQEAWVKILHAWLFLLEN